MKDKITLLMEETGCDEGEAELALELCGYELDQAVRTIARLLRNIVVFKGKFIHPGQDQFGLFLVILNTKSGDVLRSRAVLSFNPAIWSASLDKGWFDFEKYLYGCRLWEGSLPNESLEIERSLAAHFRAAPASAIAGLAEKSPDEVAAQLSGILKGLFHSQTLSLKLKKDVLELGQFQSLRPETGGLRAGAGRRPARAAAREEELLVLKVALEEDPEGVPASELHIGDMVSLRITDSRDIAQYLGKLFGGHGQQGPARLAAPVEAIESVPPSSLLVRARFSIGVCGDAVVSRESRLRAVPGAMRRQESLSWWQRFFKS